MDSISIISSKYIIIKTKVMKENYKEIQENTKKFKQWEMIKDVACIIGLTVIGAMLLISCTQNTGSNCEDPVKVESVKEYVHGANTLGKSNSKVIPNLALTSDKIIEGDLTVQNDINLNGYSLVVYGNVKASRVNGPGNLSYCTKELRWGTQNGVNKIKLDCSTLGMEEVVTVQEYYDCE
jgi:hypothetical protein